MKIYVVATRAVKKPHPDDRDVQGVYALETSKEMDFPMAISAVMDTFHAHIGIKVLDDFCIFATDGEKIVKEDENYDSSTLSLEDEAEYLGKLTADVPKHDKDGNCFPEQIRAFFVEIGELPDASPKP